MGDSMLNKIEGSGLRKKHYVKVQPGFTSEDLLDIVKPHAKRKPDLMIIHVGANDLTAVDGDGQRRHIDTENNIMKIRDTILDYSPDTEVVLSLPTPRFDDEKVTGKREHKDISRKTENIHQRLTEMCTRERMQTLDHSNFKRSHLGKGLLHPTGPGKGLLANNFIDFIDKY